MQKKQRRHVTRFIALIKPVAVICAATLAVISIGAVPAAAAARAPSDASAAPTASSSSAASATQNRAFPIEYYDRPFPYDCEYLGSTSALFNTDYWHYSDGRWLDGNRREAPIIDGSDTFWERPDLYYDRPGMNIVAEGALPEKVKRYLNAGSFKLPDDIYISVTPERPESVNTDRDIGYGIKNGKVYIIAKPEFRVYKNRSYRDYVPELEDVIPIVEEGYGWNTYSIYTRGGEHIGALEAAYKPDAERIEYDEILDIYGNLRPGKVFRVENPDNGNRVTVARSGDVNIGKGTFNSAGAVGMWFQYRFAVHFYRAQPGDLETVEIKSPNRSDAGKQTFCVVAVRNNANMPYTGKNAAVLRVWDGIRASEVKIELGPGESRDVRVPWKAPVRAELDKLADGGGGGGGSNDGGISGNGSDGGSGGTVKIAVTATINPDNELDETDLSNNAASREVHINLPDEPVQPPPRTTPTPQPPPPRTPAPGAALQDYSVIGFREDKYMTGQLVKSYVKVRREPAAGAGSGDPATGVPGGAAGGGARAVPLAFFDGVATQYQNVVLMPGGEAEAEFEWYTPQSPGAVTVSANINPDRAVGETDFTNNKQSYEVQVVYPPADLTVSGVVPSQYPAGLNVVTVVHVRNTGERDFSGGEAVGVRLRIPAAGYDETVSVNIDKNSTASVPFGWTAPEAGSPAAAGFTLTAEVNPSRAASETDYTNNTFTINASVTENHNPAQGCDERRRTWSEKRISHYETLNVPGPGGNIITFNFPVYSTYYFYVETGISAALSHSTIKSGYGLECDVSTTVVTNYDSTTGVSGLQEVYAYLPNDGYTRAIKLEAVPGAPGKWRFPVNPSSVNGSRAIYVPIGWPDGGTYEIRFTGFSGQSPGGAMCASASASVTVYGNMYEDDYTAPTN